MENSGKEVGQCAAILSMVEVGLGSVFHSFHVPTSGHWLSLNQAFWLSRLTFKRQGAPDSRTDAMAASNVTACLKSLSPAGKRLSPMLAISAQGGLFNGGTLVFGRNAFGACVGAVLLSLWAFAHPIVIYYLIFGKPLLAAYAVFYRKCQHAFHFSDRQALAAITLIVSIKALLAVAVVLAARWLPQERVDRYQERLIGIARSSPRALSATEERPRASSAAIGALRDLLHPLFLISIALTILFLFWSESAQAALIWGLLRPLAMGFILFFGVRLLPMGALIDWLERRGFHRFAGALRLAKNEVLRK